MFDAKKLTEEQVATIRGWAAEGDQLADIQKRMESEMDIRLTYMDTRFLILDLGIELKKEDEEVEEQPEPAEDEAEKPLEELTEDDMEILPPADQGGNVRVTVDEIARPGMMVTGKVTFSDGQSGMWYVDEMGRLGIDPDQPGYRPTESDITLFQKELQTVMRHH